MKEFDQFVAKWQEENSGEPDVPALFAQFLANAKGGPVIGGPVGEAPAVVAVPEEEED